MIQSKNRLILAVDPLLPTQQLPVKETNETTIKISGLNRTSSPAISALCVTGLVSFRYPDGDLPTLSIITLISLSSCLFEIY